MKGMCQTSVQLIKEKHFCCIIVGSVLSYPIFFLKSLHHPGWWEGVCVLAVVLFKNRSKEVQLKSLEDKWDYIVEAASRHHRHHSSEVGSSRWPVFCRLI